MVWACVKNGWVPHGQKGVDVVSKWRADTRETEVRWIVGVKVALGNRGMTVEARKRSERVESPGPYVTEWVSREGARGGMPLHDAVGINLKGHNYWKSRSRCQVYWQRGVCWWFCMLSNFTWLPIHGRVRKSWYIIIIIIIIDLVVIMSSLVSFTVFPQDISHGMWLFAGGRVEDF